MRHREMSALTGLPPPLQGRAGERGKPALTQALRNASAHKPQASQQWHQANEGLTCP
jgi:hypothetical protein